jgi:hypothetical protein
MYLFTFEGEPWEYKRPACIGAGILPALPIHPPVGGCQMGGHKRLLISHRSCGHQPGHTFS